MGYNQRKTAKRLNQNKRNAMKINREVPIFRPGKGCRMGNNRLKVVTRRMRKFMKENDRVDEENAQLEESELEEDIEDEEEEATASKVPDKIKKSEHKKSNDPPSPETTSCAMET